ncbi:hypothetical protein QYE76_068379 [Lolium multiflorum]|uniref:Uncharacterized protein n=1 Tax=Lolium multiflorum TaxID=4521 RepID=A0AAD8SF66_LOLMU|nr:hypothetical protein QYE76_068379 [Lolium multiflorum]
MVKKKNPTIATGAATSGVTAKVTSAVEEARTSPAKRSIGGFADEDDLLDWDEGFVEPPPKRAKLDTAPPAAAASEASAPQAAPAAQASTASSLSKGKDVPATTMAPPSVSVISSLEAFASQFTSLEADNVRLQEEVKSSSSKLDGAIKKAAIARQEVDSLKEELGKLKERLKEEETRVAEKDELLQQSSLALLGKLFGTLMRVNVHVRWEPQEEGMMRTVASFPSERNQGLSNQEEPRSTLKVDGGEM